MPRAFFQFLSKEGIRIRGATFPLSTRGSITNGKPVRGLPNELYTNWAVASIVSNFTKGEEARIVTERSGIALKTDSQLLHGCADRHGNSAPFRNGWGGVTRQRGARSSVLSLLQTVVPESLILFFFLEREREIFDLRIAFTVNRDAILIFISRVSFKIIREIRFLRSGIYGCWLVRRVT